jgi:hypothetical protein
VEALALGKQLAVNEAGDRYAVTHVGTDTISIKASEGGASVVTAADIHLDADYGLMYFNYATGTYRRAAELFPPIQGEPMSTSPTPPAPSPIGNPATSTDDTLKVVDSIVALIAASIPALAALGGSIAIGAGADAQDTKVGVDIATQLSKALGPLALALANQIAALNLNQ